MKVKSATEQRHITELRQVRTRISKLQTTQMRADSAIRKLEDKRLRIIDKLGYVPYGL